MIIKLIPIIGPQPSDYGLRHADLFHSMVGVKDESGELIALIKADSFWQGDKRPELFHRLHWQGEIIEFELTEVAKEPS